MKQKVRIDYPSHIRFGCLKCALCCGNTQEKTRHIILLRKEAEEISKKIQQPITKFSVPIEGKPPYVFEMKKKKDGKCIFLDNDRCSIYPERPLVCRFYPFELKPQQEQTFNFIPTEECPGINTGLELDLTFFKNLFNLASSRLRENSENSLVN